MSPEDQKYYENYFDVFATVGWKQFIEEIEEILGNYRIEDIKDEKQLAFVKGERDALRRILRFEGGVKRGYDLITEQSDAEEI